MDISKTCCFTGHRPQKFPFSYDEFDPRCQFLKKLLDDEINAAAEAGVTAFISGMAMGVDIWCAESVLKLKARREVSLIAAVPFLGQSDGFTADYKRRYARIMQMADSSKIISAKYTPSCLAERNRFMVDSSQYVIAVLGSGAGGTRRTVEYAKKKGRQITVIDAATGEITRISMNIQTGLF